MFRVLSEEESKKVTRWQAPDLGSNGQAIANTRQQAQPRATQGDAEVQTLLGSLSLKPGALRSPAVAPRLQSFNQIDVLANHLAGRGSSNESADTSAASAQMLQDSYDEGYATGYAQGNLALQQHAIKELQDIVTSITQAASAPDEHELEQTLVALSLDIARLVIGRELSIDDKALLSIVQAGLEQLPGGASATPRVYLHPLDANIVRRHLDDDSTLSVQDDPLLPRSACRIESGASVVNAGVDDWLDTVASQLGLLPDRAE